MRITYFFVFNFYFAIFGCVSSKPETNTGIQSLKDSKSSSIKQVSLKQPKNIIFMIGDGMGIVQISASMYLNDNKISLERFPVVGLHKPHSADNLITDSAAGATAFATGHKTFNGAISLDMDRKALPTILEEAESKGLATGLVATCGITHATPAAYIAHNESRDNKEAIALDFLETEIDIFIGGGKDYFDHRESDRRDLLSEMRGKGYQIEDYQMGKIENMDINTQFPYIYFSADKHPTTAVKGRDYLRPASITAVDFLKQRSEKGFFIMIEGSQIDWGGHDNDANYIITEMNDFDQTINAVLDWVIKDGETLLVVTADHETGGFAINAGVISDTLETSFTTGQHTATLIPVFAYGPGSELFNGVYENTDIYHKMRTAYGWGDKLDK